MIKNKILKNFDYVLMILVIVIFSLGMIAIASATNVPTEGVSRQFKMQVIAFVLGIIVMIVMQFFDYEILGDLYKVIYVVSLLLLLLVYVPGLGVVRNNARSWIALGPIDFQTSEMAKIGFIIAFSKFLEKNNGIQNIKDVAKCLILIAPFLVLLLKQPDLGSALVFMFIAFGMMFSNGLKYIYIISTGILGVIGFPFIYNNLKSHQQSRIDAFMNPNDTSLPGNYQVMQSKITIGSGQMYGRGIFQGIYHRLEYLPVQESDFIFAVFVEETGFFGGAIVILLYGLFLFKLITLCKKTKDDFGSNIIMGVLFMFAFQIFENIGMTVGLMPVTGITLPFFSYGASSVVTSLIALALVENIVVRRKKLSFGSY